MHDVMYVVKLSRLTQALKADRVRVRVWSKKFTPSVASQDDDRSMIVNVGSGSESDDSIQHSDSSPSNDGENNK